MVMIPPERPTCDICLDAAVMCECPNLTCSQEVLIPLVYRTEPCNRRESLDLFATYLERHLATRSIDIRRFINDYAKELKAVAGETATSKADDFYRAGRAKLVAVMTGQGRAPTFG